MLHAVVLSPLDASLLALLREHAVPAILGMARIGACFAWIPYLSSGVMPARLPRAVIALAVMIGLWPVAVVPELPDDLPALAITTLREAIIGTAIGLVAALPFHVFHGMGAIVDNQRGAGIGAMVDPVSGVEATETANLIQMLSVVVFLLTGGLVALLEVLQASYAVAPMGAGLRLDLQGLQVFAGTLLAGALRMALPVLLLLFLVELLLGVISRFAQQMNAFSVSLAVKSFVAFLALLIYLMPTVGGEVPALRDQSRAMHLLLPLS